jgi:hypothetical protein
MSASEIAGRIVAATKVRFDHAFTEPKRRQKRDFDGQLGSHSSQPWLSQWPKLNPSPYLERADAVMQGWVSIFGQPFQVGNLPNWNKEPLSGKLLELDYGPYMSLRNPEKVGSIKHLWELNRHRCLVDLAQAWRLSGREEYLSMLLRRLESWLDQCPARRGANWHGPHEAAMRLINWSICWHLLDLNRKHSDLTQAIGSALLQRWAASAAEHVKFIRQNPSRGSSANNHLFGEMAGIFVATMTWNAWPNANTLCTRAMGELERETLLQILPDGVGAEQSPSYLAEICDMLGFCIALGSANHRHFSSEAKRRHQKALAFLRLLTSLSSPAPNIGDCDDAIPIGLGNISHQNEWQAIIEAYAESPPSEHGEFPSEKRAWIASPHVGMGAQISKPSDPTERQSSSLVGGYLIAQKAFQDPRINRTVPIAIIADAGCLGYLSIAAHGHADALALYIAIGRVPFLVDPGTFSYRPNDPWRNWFRGTMAHNTVAVDRENQSLMTGPFMWSHHAVSKVISFRENDQELEWIASHDGYRRLRDPVKHTRKLLWSKNWTCLIVTDIFECDEGHQIDWTWQVSPQWEVSISSSGAVASFSEFLVRIECPPGLQFVAKCGEDEPFGGWISTRLFEKRAAPRLSLSTTIARSSEFKTSFTFDSNSFDSLVFHGPTEAK